MKFKESKIQKLSVFGLLLFCFCSSCEESLIDYQYLGCEEKEKIDVVEGLTALISADMQIAGAWYLTVSKHRLSCLSDLVNSSNKYSYDKLSSDIFYLETKDSEVFYIAPNPVADQESIEKSYAGDWEEGKLFILTLPLKSDQSSNSIQSTSLKLYFTLQDTPSSDKSPKLLKGIAHYLNGEQVIMTGEFDLKKLGD